VPFGGACDDFIAAWISIAGHARTHAMEAGATPEARQRHCEHKVVQISLDNLMTFPWVRERVEAGRLTLHGWYFDLTQGKLETFDGATSRFQEMEAATDTGGAR
jgi:carbonic anhydrase